MEIGQRLRQFRLIQGLTLAELASRSELSKGFLSQVENDLTSPSIATLDDICAALGISLATFFSQDGDQQQVFTPRDYFVDDQGDRVVTWIVPNAQKNRMEPILLTLKPYSQSQVIESFDGEALGYVLKGRLKLVVNQQTTSLKKGDTFYVSGRTRHFIKNDSKQEASLLWVLTPPNF